jgi:hypothetical protein
MNAFRHTACILLAAAFLAPPVYATSFSTDQSDLWYIPAESGWGMQLVQRGSVIFATLFVYGPSGQPTWYTATMDNTSGFTWTGTLYATTGDYFATVPFNPADVTLTNVGTMTWQGQTTTTGTLTYVVDGITVVKNVVRQTLVLDDFSGHYAGWAHRVFTGCTNPAANGTSDVPRIDDITQTGTAITTVSTFPNTGNVCTFTGTVTEYGQMGDFEGSFTCTDGSAGTGSSFEVQVTISGISFRHSDNYALSGCQNDGWFGGAVVTTF